MRPRRARKRPHTDDFVYYDLYIMIKGDINRWNS